MCVMNPDNEIISMQHEFHTEAKLNEFCTVGECAKYLKTRGAVVSVAELRSIARDKDLPFRKGAGRTFLFKSQQLLRAYESTFLRPSEILALARARRRKEAMQ